MSANTDDSHPTSLSPAYFEAMYRHDADPWDFATSAYEHDKYKDTLSSLPRPTYHYAFEVGCSIGILTECLAARCHRLLAVDVSERALEQARRRCRHLNHVTFEKRCIPEDFPDDRFDLILLSEVGYYWSVDDLEKARQLCTDHLRPQGHLLLVHWTPYVEDYPLTGDEVHEHFLSHAPHSLHHLHGHARERYRLDLLERADR